MAQAHVEFQRRWDWDLLKVTPAASYFGDDWGLRAGYKPNSAGVRHITDRPVKKPADWRGLRPLDVTAGAYGRELHALRLIRDALSQVLILSTIFSPLTPGPAFHPSVAASADSPDGLPPPGGAPKFHATAGPGAAVLGEFVTDSA